MFKRAARKQSKLRLALTGPSGSGKTYSALVIAQGLGGPIAMIDTERGSGELYSDICDYDVAQISPPFHPQRYIDAIRAAENSGYHVILIDSLSHAWSGEGGILDIHDKVAKSHRNSFTAWREVTPQHNALVDAMLQSSCHIIVTMRTKTAYEIQPEEKKTKVVKVGLAPIQREGLEYEFTAVLDLAVEGHVAASSKDRTGLFDGKYFVPNVQTGATLLAWLNSGSEHSGSSRNGNADYLSQLQTSLQDLGIGDNYDAYAQYVLGRYRVLSLTDLTPEQIQEQINLLHQCRKNPRRKNQLLEILRQQPLAA